MSVSGEADAQSHSRCIQRAMYVITRALLAGCVALDARPVLSRL